MTKRSGFTMIELVLVFVLMGIVLALAQPSISRSLRVERVNRARTVIAADLEMAFSLAARQRRPVRITWDDGTATYTLADRRTGTSYLRRPLGTSSAFTLTSVTFSTSPLDVFPGGFASGPLTVTIGTGNYSRRVRMTRAGLVLVGP